MRLVEKHVLVCINERPDSAPKGCCARRGGLDVFKALKSAVQNRDLNMVKVTRTGCLGPCEQGPNLVVYPDGIWYQAFSIEDIDAFIDQHLIGGKPLERLVNPNLQTKQTTN